MPGNTGRASRTGPFIPAGRDSFACRRCIDRPSGEKGVNPELSDPLIRPIGLTEGETATIRRNTTRHDAGVDLDAGDGTGTDAGRHDDVDLAVASARAVLEADRRRDDPARHLLRAEEEVGLAVLMRGRDRMDHEPGKGFAAGLAPLDERRRAFDALVLHNIRLVHAAVAPYLGQGVDREDLVQHGVLGVMRAAEKFDPRAGTRFSTYATWWIRQAVSRAVADEGSTIRIPAHVRDVVLKVAVACRRSRERGLRPRPQDLAAELDLPPDTVNLALRVSRPADSLDRVADGVRPAELAISLRDAIPGPEETLRAAFGRQWVDWLLEPLPARNADIVRRRNGVIKGEPQTLKDIGVLYGVTRERIRQNEKRALAVLRDRLGAPVKVPASRRGPFEQVFLLAVSSVFQSAYARLAPRSGAEVDAVVTGFHRVASAWAGRPVTVGAARDPRIRILRIGTNTAWYLLVLALGDDRKVLCSLLGVLPRERALVLARSRLFDLELVARPGRASSGIPEPAPEAGDRETRAGGPASGGSPDGSPDGSTSKSPDGRTGGPADGSQGTVWPASGGAGSAETGRPPSPGEIVLVDGPDELRSALSHPFVVWRSFLHPDQRRIAYQESYSGPVQLSGGAGTGKTIIALHRAAYLAHRVAASRTGGTVLLTTYARNLAEELDRRLVLLVDDANAYEHVEVSGIDRLALRVVRAALGHYPQLISRPDLIRRWDDAALRAGLPYGGSFLIREWEQVILAQDIRDEEQYLGCARPGRGTGLPRQRRAAIWRVIDEGTERLRSEERRTYLQLADEAARLLREKRVPPYRHVIVDEAQDLHPAQWRLLRAAVAPGPDDLFLVGDPHQRIHDHRVSLSALGINVRGRSRRVKVHYRTTQEILDWAVPLLDGRAVSGFDGTADDLSGYRSPIRGDKPTVFRAETADAEMEALADQVGTWLNGDVEPASIAVITRFFDMARTARDALTAAGIPATFMGGSGDRDAVRVGVMHKAKGLEFRCVAVVGVSAGVIPRPSVLTPEDEDAVTRALDVQRERSLLFVACTRARDRLYVSHTGSPSPFLSSTP
uniref:Putative DNA helicase n=1 Tax=Streptomyces argenteolus TaxID=67274 RepID=A9ZNU0_9ACTN|nr:putative DNA helicase [Streptomyces argenteolus]